MDIFYKSYSRKHPDGKKVPQSQLRDPNHRYEIRSTLRSPEHHDNLMALSVAERGQHIAFDLSAVHGHLTDAAADMIGIPEFNGILGSAEAALDAVSVPGGRNAGVHLRSSMPPCR